MNDAPWLRIPADEYEAHMRAVGQDCVLREAFARAVAETRPARVAVLGCTTGEDLAHLDPSRTTLAVGVDINAGDLLMAPRLQPVGMPSPSAGAAWDWRSVACATATRMSRSPAAATTRTVEPTR